MAKVGDITLSKDIWSSRDVFSKCVIVPSEIREKTNPLPDSVLEAGEDCVVAAYASIFGDEFLTWNVHSLLLPSDTVLENMCKTFPIAESSMFELMDATESSESDISCESSDEC